ncbi:MAG: wax ester/triacylglycerol synthase family O-acyltransferase [Solirubrobacteraceae bacterium]
MTRMSSADAAWLHMDRPTNLMVINSVMLFDEQISLDRLKRTVQVRLIDRYPRFRRRVVESRLPVLAPSWEDDPDFSLDHHIHHRALPVPGDDAALRELVGDLMTVPLDRARPLWNLYLVDNYNGGGCALISRMHHCIADGIALGRVMLSLTDSTRRAPIAGAREADAPPTAAVASNGGGSGPRRQTDPLRRLTDPLVGGASLGRKVGGALVKGGLDIAAHPRHAAELAGAVARDAGTLAKLTLTPADQASALKGDPGVSRRVTWTEPISLELVKRIAHSHEATVNDVLLASVSGALRHYLQDRGSDAPEIQALVPFNLRALDEPIPRELGNRFGLVFLPLPVGTSGSYRRLVEVSRRMDAIKSSRDGAVSYGLLGAIGMTPVGVEKRVVDMFSGKGTAVMTNVPGPRKTIYLAGVPVKTVLFWGPTSGHVGMSVAIFSYRGEVTVGLMVDAKLVPDPDAIADGVMAELDTLADLQAA